MCVIVCIWPCVSLCVYRFCVFISLICTSNVIIRERSTHEILYQCARHDEHVFRLHVYAHVCVCVYCMCTNVFANAE